jgi:ComF family protein
MVYAVLSRLQWLLLPPTCVLCAQNGQAAGTASIDLCAACAGELPINTPACKQCGEHLEGSSAQLFLCGACLRKPPRYNRTHCAYRYSYPIDHLVRAFKYHDRLTHARVLGHLLAQSLAFARVEPWPELLIPVPLAEQRFRERGFNQASELAAQLQYKLSIPLRVDLLERKRVTREQAGLDRLGRRKNVRNAFAIREPLNVKHIAIVDDVVTTGSTVNEIARVLKRAGAETIEVWAVARASR